MIKRRFIVSCVVLALAALWLAGCSTDREPGDLFAPEGQGTLVVDVTMQTGKPFPVVLLTRAMRPDEPFFLANWIVVGATVVITDALTGVTMTYTEGVEGGRYYPNAPDVLVAPGHTYNLRVTTREGEVLTATTTTPERFIIDNWVLKDDTGSNVIRTLRTFLELGDSVYYAPENQLVYSEGLLEARFKDAAVPHYQVGIFSLDWDSDLVIDPEFLDEEDLADLERYISSPPFIGDGGSLRLPWFAIFYAGRYKLKIYALDRNWYDLVRSVPELGGGPTFGGNTGEGFESPIFHINGGIGLFGSASADSIGFFIHPRPAP